MLKLVRVSMNAVNTPEEVATEINRLQAALETESLISDKLQQGYSRLLTITTDLANSLGAVQDNMGSVINAQNDLRDLVISLQEQLAGAGKPKIEMPKLVKPEVPTAKPDIAKTSGNICGPAPVPGPEAAPAGDCADLAANPPADESPKEQG